MKLEQAKSQEVEVYNNDLNANIWYKPKHDLSHNKKMSMSLSSDNLNNLPKLDYDKFGDKHLLMVNNLEKK